MTHQFALTTQQATRLLDLPDYTLYTAHKRTGSYKGVKPTKLRNGRLVWPRAGLLALKGLKEVGRDSSVDLRAWIAVMGNFGYLADDLMVSQAADLLNPFPSERYSPESVACEQIALLAQMTKVISNRLMAAWPKLNSEYKGWARDSLAQIKLEVEGSCHAIV